MPRAGLATIALATVALAAAAAWATPASAGSPRDPAAQGDRLAALVGGTVIDAAASQPDQSVFDAIAEWLSVEFALPITSIAPTVALVPAEQMRGIRYGAFTAPSEVNGGGPGEKAHAHDIVALYDDQSQTIYLPSGWSGETPAELSILVHEMAHHMQNLGGVNYACPQEREKVSFAAQQRWLGRFGTNLEREFGIDGFTLLVRTNCMY
jgi:hypothetical protein